MGHTSLDLPVDRFAGIVRRGQAMDSGTLRSALLSLLPWASSLAPG